MQYLRSRVLGLANGTIEPESGIEKHFVKVCQGQGRPASATEWEWMKIVENPAMHMDDIAIHVANFPKDSAESFTAVRLEELRNEFTLVAQENEELKGELLSSKEKVQRLTNEHFRLCKSVAEQRQSIEQHKVSENAAKNTELKLGLALKETQANLDELERKLVAAENEIGVFKRSIDVEIQRLLPQVICDIRDENKRVLEYNKKFSEQNSLLANELKRHIPVRIKCTVCYGEGKWVDKGTFRDGADYDGPNAVEVCSNCNGAGYLYNPKREELGIN